MNIFLMMLRRMALAGIVASIITLLPGFLILFVPLYLLFMLFTWLQAKHNTDVMSDKFGVEIPYNNYFKTLIRGLGIDIISPITSVVGLFKDAPSKVANFAITYVILIANAILVIFIWLIEFGVLAVFQNLMQ